MDGDRLVPSEPEQQVTWWVLTAQPLETPYCAWAAEAGSEQACRIGFTASLPRPSDVLRPSVQHAWPFPGETAMSAMGAVPSQQPTPRPQTLCAGCPERLPSPKDDTRGIYRFISLLPGLGHLRMCQRGWRKGRQMLSPPEGSETEWTREEGRVTVGEDSTSSPLGL